MEALWLNVWYRPCRVAVNLVVFDRPCLQAPNLRFMMLAYCYKLGSKPEPKLSRSHHLSADRAPHRLSSTLNLIREI